MKLSTVGQITWRCGVLSALMAASNVGFAVTPVGPGEYRVETAADVSYVQDGFAVLANAAIAVRPGIFYPKDGPTGVDEVIWRNVKLTDIESFTGRISNGSGDSYYWMDATCYHIVTNVASGYVQCQLQLKVSQTLYGFVMQYRQVGNDVKARIYLARYASTNVSGQDIGCDMTQKGLAITVTNSPYVVANTIRAISDLGYVLREGAEATEAPTEIVLTSTDESPSDEETYRYIPCLMDEKVMLCRNLRICDIVGISGEMSNKSFGNGEWTAVQGYCLSNYNSYVQMNLMLRTSRRFGVNVRFYQENSDVLVRAAWAGHSYDDKTVEEPFGSGIIGAELGITNEPNTAKIAVRNLKVRFRPKSRIVGDFEPCIVKEDGWTKIWPDVKLQSVTFGPALMGGYSLGSVWNVASNYLRTVWAEYTDQSYYQFYKTNGSELYSIRFLMQQQFGDIYARIASARYTSGKPVGYDPGTANYQTAVTNTVDGRSTSLNRTVAICHITADMPARKRHAVMVGDDFNPGLSPIRLDSIKLALTPSANASMSFDSDVHGCGVIGVSGAGAVTLAVDLPKNVGLDVDSGTAVVNASRAVGGLVNVASGATLEFVVANGSRPALSAPSFSIESGAEIAVSADGRVADIPEAGETFKVVTGCNYAGYDFDGVACRVSGSLFCSASVAVDEDGDIAVTIKPKKGFMVTIQ